MQQYFSTRRIEALTDGVFAIAMTLLVLDLKAASLGNINSSAQLVEALSNNLTVFSSFIISFLLLGSMWAVHVRQFEYIKRADRHLTMINTLRLLAVVLIPLTTSLAGTYPDIALGRVLFPINFLVLALLSYWQWRYAASTNKLYDKMPEGTIEYAEIRNRAIVLQSAIVVVLAVWIGQVAFLIFLATPWFFKWLKK